MVAVYRGKRYRDEKPLFLIDTLLVGVGNPKKLPKLCGVAKPACGLLLIKEKRHSDFSLTNKKRKSASATFSFNAAGGCLKKNQTVDVILTFSVLIAKPKKLL